MKNIYVFIGALLLLSSCSEAYRVIGAARTGTRLAAGRTTSYMADYEFYKDSIVVDDSFIALERYFQDKNWNVTRESNQYKYFEYSTAPIDQTATGKQANGTANFVKDQETENLKLTLRLRGNYQYGTKKKSLKFYNELRHLLYGLTIEEPTRKKKKK